MAVILNLLLLGVGVKMRFPVPVAVMDLVYVPFPEMAAPPLAPPRVKLKDPAVRLVTVMETS